MPEAEVWQRCTTFSQGGSVTPSQWFSSDPLYQYGRVSLAARPLLRSLALNFTRRLDRRVCKTSPFRSMAQGVVIKGACLASAVAKCFLFLEDKFITLMYSSFCGLVIVILQARLRRLYLFQGAKITSPFWSKPRGNFWLLRTKITSPLHSYVSRR